MILTVFRPKRIKNGKVQIARSYRGRYRLDGEKKITDIPLHTTDRRVAQQRIEQIVKEKQMEAVGLLAPHAVRVASQTRLERHLSDYVADLQAVGRDGQYIYELGNPPIMNASIPDYAAVAEEIRGLESHLSSKIRGQQHAISRVCSVLERGQFGLNPIEKPLGSFLFLGPTGVGKTGLTLEFAHYLFGDNHVFRFDMSEFLHLDNVKLFMGDETGRVGRLGELLARHQKGVLLFDEIEKAHRLIWDLFLQMLDAARITLADHRTYNLSGFYMVCTSNIGSQQLLRPTRLPFTALERAVIAELHRFFRPELIGRFDEKIVFRPLSPEVQREIGSIAICEELDRFNDRGFNLTISEEAFEFLIRRGIQKTLGARPMRKTVEKFIGDAVRDALKSGARSSGILTVSTLNDRLIIQ